MAAHVLLLQLAILLLAARFFAEVAERLQVPPVLGELLAGVILGPSVLGWLQPNDVLALLSQIGIILLLFQVGIDTDITHLVRAGPKATVVALTGFALPFLLGCGVSRWGFDLPLVIALFVGGTLTATSIGITVRVLVHLRRARGHEGQVVLGAAVVDDILGVVLLALLYDFSRGNEVSFASASQVMLFVALFFVVAPPVDKVISLIIRHFNRVSGIPGLIPTTIVSLVLASAWLARFVGAPELLGGFAAGLALSREFLLPGYILRDERFSRDIRLQMQSIVQLFTPIFFVMVGLSLNLRAVEWHSPFIWAFGASIFVIATVGKLAGGLIAREPWPVWLAIGVSMVPRGEVGLVFAELGRASGIFDNDIYAALIIVIAGTTLIAPLILRSLYRCDLGWGPGDE